MKIKYRIFVLMTLFVAVISGIYSYENYVTLRTSLLDGIDRNLITAATMARETLPEDYHDLIVDDQSVSKEDFEKTVARYNQLCVDLDLKYLWSLLKVDDQLVFTSSTSPDHNLTSGKHAKFYEAHSNSDAYEKVLTTGKIQNQTIEDKWGKLRTVLVPYTDAKGRPYLFGACVEIYQVDQLLQQMVLESLSLGGGFLLLGLIFSYVMASMLASPLQRLTEQIRQITNGEANGLIEEKGSYEQVALARSFNQMSQVIASNMSALSKSESKYRGLVESSNDWIWEVDLSAKFTYSSPQVEQFTGYSVDEIVGKTPFELMSSQEAARIKVIFDQLSKAGKPITDLENVILKADGSEVTIETSGMPIYDDNEQLIGYCGVNRDITIRKQVEVERERSRVFLQTIIDGIPESLMVINRDYTIAMANHTVVDMSGCDPISNCLTCHQISHASEKPCEGEDHFCPLKQVIETKEKVTVEHTHYDQHGNAINVELIAAPVLGEDGEVHQIIELSRDITDRRKAEETLRISEERLDLAMSVANDGVFDWDVTTNNTFFDTRYYTMVGYEPDEFPSSFDQWAKRVHPDDFSSVQKDIDNYLTGKTSKFDVEYRFSHKEGHWVWIRARAITIDRDERGLPKRIVGTHADITERRQAEHNLRRHIEMEQLVSTLSAQLLNTHSGNINPVIDYALTTIGQVLDVDRSYIFQFSEDGQFMANTNEWCAEGIEPQKENLQGLPVDVFPWWMQKMQYNEHIYAPRVSELPEEADAEKQVLQEQGIQSLLVVPLYSGSNLFGFLGLDYVRHETTCSEEDITLLHTLGESITSAIKRQAAEDALRESEEKYRILTNNQSDLVVKVDLDGKFLFVSPAYSEVFGKTEEELLGNTFMPLVHEDDIGHTTEEMKKLFKPPYRATIQQRALTKCGWRWFEWADSAVLNDHNEVIEIIGVGRDITERIEAEEAMRLSEEKFSRAFRASPDTIAITRLSDGLIIDINPAFEQMFNRPINQALGKTTEELDLWVDPASRNHMIRQLQTKGAYHSFETKFRRVNGELFDVIMSCALLTIAGEKCILSILRDISDLKKAELEREKLIAELEVKNQEMERLIYTISHDMKTPLVTMGGYLGMLKRDTENGELNEAAKDIRHIENATGRMRELLDDLLQISRIGRLRHETEKVDIKELAEQAIELVGGHLSHETITYQISDDLPTVHGDRSRLLELLQNLIENAVKYMGDHPQPKIEIGCEEIDNQNVCYVKDNGIGIQPEYHEKIFNLFEQLDPHKSDGTGAGLAIVKRIVETYGGKIWLESEGVGMGTTFYFTMPQTAEEGEI